MSFTALLAAGFASWRLAHMVVHEDGPFDLFTRLRGIVILRVEPGGWIERGFSCVLCVSFWTALLAVALLALSGEISGPIWFTLAWLGVAGIAAALQMFVTRGDL